MPRKQAGLTLIEIAVALMIIGVLAAIALPSFQAWIQNSQIRTAAESVLNGLQFARAESVRRNLQVEFILVAPGSNWSSRIANTGEVLQTRSGGEGSTTALTAALPGGADTLTFNGMGWIAANADGSASITQVDVTSSVLTGPDARPLRLVVTAGGSVKMCDPQVAAPDPRACP